MDVGIVGAGPAGAHAAHELAALGHRVSLYDHRVPWEKACGGGAPYRAAAQLGMLEGLPRCEVRVAILEGPSGGQARVRLDEPLIIFSRTDLSRHMLQRAVEAGVRHEARRVAAVGPAAAGAVQVRLDGGAVRTHELLVGADGARSVVRRTLGTAFRPAELTQAAGYTTAKALGDRVVLRFCKEIPGYVWYFPRLDHASVGVCAPLGAAGQGGLGAELDRFCADWGIAPGPAYGALIPCSARAAAGAGISGPGWALIGDAAGVVDPITREGIYYAARTAELLVRAVAEAPQPDRLAGAYARLVREELGDEMQRAHRIAGSFYRPRFTAAMVLMTRHSSSLRAVMADLLACRQGYVGLKGRLLRALPRVALQVAIGLALPGRPAKGGTAPGPGA
jgi:flavin-dependent dehydrogenase